MARKKRRQPRSIASPGPVAPAARTRLHADQSTVPAAAASTVRVVAPARPSAATVAAKDDVAVQYAYVRRDLMRVLVLAVLGLGIIVAATILI